ncbi:response regulator transcription factor [Polymorphobacter sp. PAMC 29334]|uniref:response regulator transcription factor n=1 Tax=Polymorphobacter sp. PAMC 29334 TaxID=2862331 RepID=UPI001C66AD1B|nr:response regulator transcription factor [Polymorphobacter sp. PAMC 29334]QYE36580.1 response regulator transcription factor [Polymorphobacter sp. PAMC 29334]
MKACLIADDHVLMREALAGTVRMAWPDVAVTEVGDFTSAWAAAAAGQPDVAIVDLMMPGASPLVGVRGIREASPETAILIVTGTEDDRLLLDLLDLGIAGFAGKTSNGQIIEAALRLIAAGGRYLPPRLAEIAASRLDTGPSAKSALPADRPGLTDRQIAVLRLVANGLSNKEVAQSLALSPATVKTHLAHVQTILGAKNRTDAASRARARGLL